MAGVSFSSKGQFRRMSRAVKTVEAGRRRIGSRYRQWPLQAGGGGEGITFRYLCEQGQLVEYWLKGSQWVKSEDETPPGLPEWPPPAP